MVPSIDSGVPSQGINFTLFTRPPSLLRRERVKLANHANLLTWEEWKLLDALPVVDTVIPDVHIHKQRKTQTQRVTCTLWCGHTHDAGDLRRPAVMCNQSNVPSVEHAVRALRLKVEAAHGGCLAAAEAARAAAAAPATRQPADAFQAMMRTARSRQAEAAAKAAEKVAAALRAAADAAAAEERQHASGSQQDEERAKRQRADAADLPFWKPCLEATPPSVATWDLKQWRTQEDEEQQRRSMKVGLPAGQSAGAEPLPPRTGKEGYLQHWRRGLIGAVQSWARGCKAHVVSMIVALISSELGFGIESEVLAQLKGGQLVKEAETNALVVDRAVAALSSLKRIGTEQARCEYHIILGALAPPMVAVGDSSGMGRRVSARLRVHRGRRARRRCGRAGAGPTASRRYGVCSARESVDQDMIAKAL